MCFTVQLSWFSVFFDSSDILSHRFELVKNFFQLFFNFFSVVFVLFVLFATAISDYHIFPCLSRTFFGFFINRAEKEGFEPSHGVNRLHP